MTVLSDIVNADIKEDDLAVVVAIVVVCISGIMFFRKNQQQYPRINQSINMYIMLFVVFGFNAIAWITIEAVTHIPSPPLQAISLVYFFMLSAQQLVFIFDILLTDTLKRTLATTLSHITLLVVFVLNQYTTLFEGDHLVGKLTRTIRIPSASILGPLILVYLVIEIIVIFIHDISLYNNIDDPETIASKCPSTKGKTISLKCLKEIRYNQTTYSIFGRLLAMIVYTCAYFKYYSSTRD